MKRTERRGERRGGWELRWVRRRQMQALLHAAEVAPEGSWRSCGPAPTQAPSRRETHPPEPPPPAKRTKRDLALWHELPADRRDPRQCVAAKGPAGSKLEQRAEVRSWRQLTGVAPWVVLALKQDGTLGARNQVPAEQRMWPAVTEHMARCRDYTQVNRGAGGGTVASAKAAAAAVVLPEPCQRAVVGKLVKWANGQSTSMKQHIPDTIVQAYVYEQLVAVPGTQRTRAMARAIELGKIGGRITRRVRQAVREELVRKKEVQQQ